MINVKIGRDAYSMSFVTQVRTFGVNDLRTCVECQIYWWDTGVPIYYATGISICHPTDKFDPRKGAHKALTSALNYSLADTRQAFHSELESWFTNEQNV